MCHEVVEIMSAGLPLLVLSILAAIILIAWSRGGSDNTVLRVKVAGAILILMVASWVALLSFGVFHPIGTWAMGFGLVVSITAFFVPIVYNKLRSH